MPRGKKEPLPCSRQALCDACAEYCDLDSREVHAVIAEGCMPLVLCSFCWREVVWAFHEREQSAEVAP